MTDPNSLDDLTDLSAGPIFVRRLRAGREAVENLREAMEGALVGKGNDHPGVRAARLALMGADTWLENERRFTTLDNAHAR